LSKPVLLGHGYYWQDLKVGDQYFTHGRTVTEFDLMSFITLTGMTEVIFTDSTYQHGAIQGRAVPGALSYTLIEGLLVQGMLQGTGLALLEVNQQVLKPVRLGDTIHALVNIIDVRPTSKHGRAVVTSTVSIINQLDEQVMRYVAKRLLAGNPG